MTKKKRRSMVNAKANRKNANTKTKGFDHDGYWKDLIERFFYPLLKRAIPKLYEIADITEKPRLLEKEFRDVLNTGDPEVHISPHFADYVIEVPTINAGTQWILCHFEAQGPGGTNLGERMYFYQCLIYAHYRRMPIGLAIITDGHTNEERFFSYSYFDKRTIYEYYNVVLADLDDDELKTSDNTIDLALYAAKCALRAKEEHQKYIYLRTLTDLLTPRGWDAFEKRNLMLFMYRIINLKDKTLQDQYWEYRQQLDREGKLMYEPFLKEAEERMAERRGVEKLVKKLIERGDYSHEVISEMAGLPVERVRTLVN